MAYTTSASPCPQSKASFLDSREVTFVMCERLVFKGVRSVTFGRLFLGSFPVRQRLLDHSYYCRLLGTGLY